MDILQCSACGMENDSNSVKCEHCKCCISDELISPVDDWEDDFRFIEEAEMKGEVYNIDSFEVTCCENVQITQVIKEEPEVQIDYDEGTVKQSIGSPKAETQLYQCNECSLSFKRMAALKAHYNAEHHVSDSETENEVVHKKNSPKALSKSADDKSKKLFNEQEVESAEETEENIPSGLFKCSCCGDTFINKFDFKIHQNQHKGKRLFQCDVCKVFLSNNTILQKHKIRLHSGDVDAIIEKRFTCVFCSETFPLQILLTNHKKEHVEDFRQIEKTATIQKIDNRLTYTCKLCGKMSSNKSRHTDHLRVHSRERPFKCDLCESKHSTRSSLIQHMRLHSDERPFKCHICMETYRHRKNLRRHLIKHTGKKPFKCDYCTKTFTLNTSKDDHTRVAHTRETPYQCVYCQKSFVTSYFLNAHLRKDHDIDTNNKRRVPILINKVASSDSQTAGGEVKL